MVYNYSLHHDLNSTIYLNPLDKFRGQYSYSYRTRINFFRLHS